MKIRKKIYFIIVLAILMIFLPKVSKAVSTDFCTDITKGKSIWGIYKAMRNNPTKWIAADVTGLDYTGWGLENTLIDLPGGVCVGHSELGSTEGENNKRIKMIVDVDGKDVVVHYNDSILGKIPNDKECLYLGYAAYKSYSIQEYGDGWGTWKRAISEWCWRNGNMKQGTGWFHDIEKDTEDLGKEKLYSSESDAYVSSMIGDNFTTTSKKEDGVPRKIEVKNKKTFIGPYNLSSRGGTLTKATVFTEDDVQITTNLCSTDGTNIEEMSNITIGEDGINTFYIVVDQNVPSVKKIVLYKKLDVVKARIVIAENYCKGVYGIGQNVAVFAGFMEEGNITLELPGIPYSKIKITKTDADTNKKINDEVKFIVKYNGKYLKRGTPVNYVDNINDATKYTTTNGIVEIDGIKDKGIYTIYEVGNSNKDYLEATVDNPSKEETVEVSQIGGTIDKTITNEKVYYLKIRKVDEDSNAPLENVGFILYYPGKGYVKDGENGKTATYEKEKTKATVYKTDKNGETIVKNLPDKGPYTVYEVENPNFGYQEVSLEKPLGVGEVTAKLLKTDLKISDIGEWPAGEVEKLTNKKIYIKLSGYVWVDDIDIVKPENKDSLYNTSNAKDLLFNGITVMLKDKRTGEIVKDEKDNEIKTTTSQLNRYTDIGNKGNGEYLFEKVLIKELENYYIEFEYDGLTYTNVIPHIDKDNGSKAEESDSDRTTFNEKFSVVEGDSKDTGHTTDAKGNKGYDLKYDKNGKEAILSSDGSYEIKTDSNGNEYMQQNSVGAYTITGNTTTAGYSIKEQYEQYEKDKKPDEIRYINLGLYKRDQPDISLEKDLYNVKVSVNGYDHVYLYDSYYTNMFKEPNSNIGVEWGYEDLRKGNAVSYTRAIYKSDYEYENATDKDKELKVYITYKLKMINDSSSLISQINSIVDYYDARYTDTVSIGTSVDNNTGTVADDTTIERKIDEQYNANGYKKIIINNGTKVKAQESESIYVQFELTRQAVADILHDKNVGEVADELLENVAEINSYSTFSDSECKKIYAGIDEDSNPGNCKPGETSEYEDDTFACPALRLEVANAREMTGTVFLDSTSSELMTGQIRQGNGQYDDGETGIDGVEVTLNDADGNVAKIYDENDKKWKEAKYTTKDGGNFTITGYIPGNYTLTYTWGDETYTVQDYKGTVYDETRYKSNQDNKYWYKEETRYTDAIDNYNTDQEAPKGSRLQIDTEMGETTELTRTKMDSTTPTMEISVEYETASTNWNDDYTFKISNVDFGIVERARQVLEVSKDVTGVKITLANGQVIVDAKIENGELKGTTAGVTYGPSDSTSKGFVKAEMDNELIQGATIQIEYTVTVANKSEKDYDSEGYYKYGVQTGNVITITPTGVYDYLDSEMVLDETQDNGNWTVISNESYQSQYAEPTIVESYFEEGKSTQVGEDGTITDVYTWSTSQTGYQRIFTEWATEITEERTVRDNKLENKTILKNADLEKELAPDTNNSVKLYTSKILANTDEIDLNNDLEVTEIKRTQEAGRIVDVESSYLYDQGERVTVTPPTGNDQNYLPYIILGITSCIILGAGVVIIKRKAI